jgi:hypothetical protein
VFPSGKRICVRVCDVAEFATDTWPTEALLLGIWHSAVTGACGICDKGVGFGGSGEENKIIETLCFENRLDRQMAK